MYFNLASFDVSFKRQRASDTGAGFPERSLSVCPEQVESLVGAAQGLPKKGSFVVGLEWKPCREATVTSLSGKVEEGRGQEGDLGSRVSMVRKEDRRVFS